MKIYYINEWNNIEEYEFFGDKYDLDTKQELINEYGKIFHSYDEAKDYFIKIENYSRELFNIIFSNKSKDEINKLMFEVSEKYNFEFNWCGFLDETK